MQEHLLGRAEGFLVSAAQVRDSAERAPRASEAGVVIRALEQWDGAQGELLDLLDPGLGRAVRPVVGRNDSRDCLARSISETIRVPGRRLGNRRRGLRRSEVLALTEVQLDLDIEPQLARQPERALEEAASGAAAPLRERAPAGGPQPIAGTQC